MKDHEAMMQALLAGETLEVPGLYNMKVTDGMVRWEKETDTPGKDEHPMFAYNPGYWQVKPKDSKDLEIARLREGLNNLMNLVDGRDFTRQEVAAMIDQILLTVSKE